MNRPLQPEFTLSAIALAQEYAFITPGLVPGETMRWAIEHSIAAGVLPHTVLIQRGLLHPDDYAAALETHPLMTTPNISNPVGKSVWISATSGLPSSVLGAANEARQNGYAVLIGPVAAFDAGLQPETEASWAEVASNAFSRCFPGFSASAPVPFWQLVAGAVMIGLLTGGSMVAQAATYFITTTLLTLVFGVVVGVRLVAVLILRQNAKMVSGTQFHPEIPDFELPTYSIIVPLHKEADVVPDLLAALCAIDYPLEKQEVLLVLESDDLYTSEAVLNCRPPNYFRTLKVPPFGPRTKPKALNYALQAARGDYVVVYDAEDVPAPDQLRRAIAAFRSGGPMLYCVQARLNIHNPAESWITRQFTLEYTALFDGFLPALTRLGLPLPLGGTSNHFPADVLKKLGGWDAYNVTEDADLGYRIARLGGRIEVLDSTTWEEAPARLATWFRQRTRWLKGWMITYLVHMRAPARLFEQLGIWKFIGFQVVLGGALLSALMHPAVYFVLAAGLFQGFLFQPTGTMFGDLIVAAAAINITAGYLSAIVLAWVGITGRQRGWLAWQLVFMPAYWLLISLAAYRAIWQVIYSPHYWEKTPHRARRLI